MKITHLNFFKDVSFLKKQIFLFFWFGLIVVSSLFSAAADPGPAIPAEQYEKEIMDLKISQVKGEGVEAKDTGTFNLGVIQSIHEKGDIEMEQAYQKISKRIKKSQNLSQEEQAFLFSLAEYYAIFPYTRSEKTPGFINPTAVVFGFSGSGVKDAQDYFLSRSFDKDLFCSKAKKIRKTWKRNFGKLKRKKIAEARDYWLTAEMDNSYAPCQPLLFIQSTSKASRKTFDQALEVDPQHPLSNIGRAVFYYRQAKGKSKAEDLNTAARLLKTAIVNGNEYERYLAHLWLSQVFLKVDKANTVEAAAEVAQARKIYSKGPFIDYVSRLLAKGVHI